MKHKLLMLLLLMATALACEKTKNPRPQFEGDRVEVSDPAIIEWGMPHSEYDEDYTLAADLIENKDYQGALDIYQNLLRIESDSMLPVVHIGIGATYQLMGENEKALASNLEALRLAPEYLHANLAVGRNYLALGDYAQGIVYYEKALAQDPSYPDCHHGLAVAYEVQGQDSLALLHAKAFLAAVPESQDAPNLQAIVDRIEHRQE